MKRALGIAISRTAVQAVAVEHGRVVWAAERVVEGTPELGTALAELAAERPHGYRRARLVLAGDLAQVRLLDGVPRLSAARLHRMVSLQATRWFLKNGGPPAIAVLGRQGGAASVAVAAGAETLEVVAQGLAAAGLRIDGTGVAAVTCATILPDGSHVLAADGVVLRIEVERGHLRAHRRSMASAKDEGVEPVVPGFDDGSRFFPAYAAAVTRPLPPLADGRSGVERLVRRRRLAVRLLVAALLLWVGSLGVLAGRVRRTLTSARREIALLAQPLDAAVAVERDVGLAEAALRSMREAQGGRSRDARLLEVLTQNLPDSAHLVSVRRGHDGRVHLAGVAWSAARVLAALGKVPEIVDPSLEGGVIREVGRGRTHERFTLTFAWRPEAAQ